MTTRAGATTHRLPTTGSANRTAGRDPGEPGDGLPVTRNDRDVVGLGATVFNPFKSAEHDH